MRTTISIIIHAIFCLAIIVCLLGCTAENDSFCTDAPDVSGKEVSLDFEVLNEQLHNFSNVNDARLFLERYPWYKVLFLGGPPQSNDSIDAQLLFDKMANTAIDTLYTEVKQTFGSFSELEAELVQAFSYLKYYFPSFAPPKVKVVYSGLSNDLYISDTLVIIGADFFIGPNATYKPMNIPEYIAKRYKKEHIVPSIIRNLSSQFISIDAQDKTMLAEMLSWGKAYYFTKSMLPCYADSLIIQYSKQEMEAVVFNPDIIWASFLQNQLIYDSNHLVKRKFLGERPKTTEIGDDCPGRVGTWLGWEIVKSYMQNNKEVTLEDLMSSRDARLIFKKSGYKPS